MLYNSTFVRKNKNPYNWIIRQSAADNEWTAVTYGGTVSLFVAVAETGNGNRIMTSPDGINWITRTSPQTNKKNGSLDNLLTEYSSLFF